jgi:hypothetical protein
MARTEALGRMIAALVVGAAVAACADQLPDQDLRILQITPAAKLSADFLWNDYQSDRNAADDRYWGRAIEMTGKVSSVSQDPPRIVFLQQTEPPLGIEARLLDERAAETLATATVGERLTLRCFCEGLAGNVVLKSCIRP